MKSIKIIFLSTIIAALTSCGGSSSTTEQVSTDQQTPIAETNKPEVELKNFTKEDVARFAMSSIMGQPSKKIKVRLENELYYVSYIRKSDSQKFNYKIKIDGKTIVWASIDGRWRDGQDDERISFEENDNKLTITQIYSDGSVDSKEYKKGE
jgi:hypothetical protein